MRIPNKSTGTDSAGRDLRKMPHNATAKDKRVYDQARANEKRNSNGRSVRPVHAQKTEGLRKTEGQETATSELPKLSLYERFCEGASKLLSKMAGDKD